MKDRTCARCGHISDGEAAFCSECGALLAQAPPEATPLLPPQPSAQLCESCGTPNSPNATFCIECGEALKQPAQDRLCPVCGVENASGAIFCVECGNPLRGCRSLSPAVLLGVGVLAVIGLILGGAAYAWYIGIIPSSAFDPIQRLIQPVEHPIGNPTEVLQPAAQVATTTPKQSAPPTAAVVEEVPATLSGEDAPPSSVTVAEHASSTPVHDASRPTATSRLTDTPVATETPTASPTPEPSSTPLPTHTAIDKPVPTSQSSLVVEAAAYYGDEAALNKTHHINDPNSTRRCTLGLASAPSQTKDERAIAFEYTIQQASPNDYCGFERWLTQAQSWSGHARLCLDVSISGTAEDLVVQFGEASGEVWKSWTASSSITEGELCLPLTTTAFARAEWAPRQNNRIDLGAITYYGIYVNGPPGASGVVYFNRIWVVSP